MAKDKNMEAIRKVQLVCFGLAGILGTIMFAWVASLSIGGKYPDFIFLSATIYGGVLTIACSIVSLMFVFLKTDKMYKILIIVCVACLGLALAGAIVLAFFDTRYVMLVGIVFMLSPAITTIARGVERV